MPDCILITGAFSHNRSRAQYQYIYHIVDSYDASVVVNKNLSEEYSEVKSEAHDIHEYSGNSYLFPIFCIFISLRFISIRNNIELIATGQSSIAILPSAVLTTLFRIDWLILAPDPPEGRIRVIREFSDESNLSRILRTVDYHISLIGYRYADVTILSDKSTAINTDNDSVIVAPGGVDCELVEQARETRPCRHKSTQLDVVYVGNMHYNRGIDIILEAIRSVEIPMKLTLIGPGPDAAPAKGQRELERTLNGNFKDSIEFKSEGKNCEYLGVLDHEIVIQKLLQSDIGLCILPYERNLPHFRITYPIKIFEYMACSMAVIATQTPATETVLEEKLQLTDNDPQEIAEKINRLGESTAILEEFKYSNTDKSQQYCWSSVREQISEELKNHGVGV
jgi:glycosyltransferase involved in cell wall biosynthesis